MDKEKIKVSTLTFQESLNYGALLQAYALKKKLQKMGCEAEVMNYHSAEKEQQYSGKYNRNQSLLRNLNRKFSEKYRLRRKKQADDFRSCYIGLSGEQLNTKEELSAYAEERDYIICGSDQIWNYNNIKGDTSYFLDFVDEPEKKISYAASFGVSQLPDEYRQSYTTLLNGFGSLSVREQTGAALVESLTGQKIPVMPDPCLLLTKEEWDDLAEPAAYNEPYIFVYYIHYSERLVRYAKELSRRTGWKVLISARTFRDTKDHFRDEDLSVPQFVGAVRNAQIVLTNSFHAVVFSVLFHRNFRAFSDERSAHNTGSRISDLLVGMKLEQFLLTGTDHPGNEELIGIKQGKPEWEERPVQDYLSERRSDAETYLKQALRMS